NERFELTNKLTAEADSVSTQSELLRFVERALMLLGDHHAITGASFSNSWAVVPSYSDLWIEKHAGEFFVTHVRADSPASKAGVRPGDALTAIGDRQTQAAIDDFWADLGAPKGTLNDEFAVRVLAAGRRDQSRQLTFQRQSEAPIELELMNLYQVETQQRPLLSITAREDAVFIKINDSLWNNDLIAEFDAAMAQLEPEQDIIIDLTNTPTGGNTVVARAIMGWFVEEATAYQIHKLPAEFRRSGIKRQWAEYVLPREGKYHSGSVTLRVGRWTGSMGEGLALGFHAMGAQVEGSAMAGLLGAVYDEKLPNSGLIVKLPVESLFSMSGAAREDFIPTVPVEF
ncbi:MAG: peptidase S41, partial [Pseudomonadota bacterium]